VKALLWCCGAAVVCVGGILAVAGFLAGGGAIALLFVGPGGDESLGACIYAGGAAGGILVLAGLPFAVVLSRIHGGDAKSDARFWTWWGSGLLLRMTLLGGMAFGLKRWYGPEHYTAATMSMMAVYLVGMFSEVAWLATVLSKSDRKATKKKA
jgi:hypothetical protein